MGMEYGSKIPSEQGLNPEVKNYADSAQASNLVDRKRKDNWIPKGFDNALEPSFEIPDGATDIGLMSVMNVSEIKGLNALSRYYAWCSPHDAPGGIHLYTASSPDGEWTEEGVVFSTADFNPTDAENRHASSPDVHWDEDLELDGEKGGFRIYFHYSHSASSPVTQRTFLAFSKDGRTLHSFYPHDNYSKPIIPMPDNVNEPDGTYSTYAKFTRQGNVWLAVYSSSVNSLTCINIAISTDDGYTFEKYDNNFLGSTLDESYTGVPSIYIANDVIYISYFSYTDPNGIQLATIHPNKEIVRYGTILPVSDNGWDNFRICSSYLFYDDGAMYLFYSGRDDRAGHVQGEWPDTQIGVTKEVF